MARRTNVSTSARSLEGGGVAGVPFGAQCHSRGRKQAVEESRPSSRGWEGSRRGPRPGLVPVMCKQHRFSGAHLPCGPCRNSDSAFLL